MADSATAPPSSLCNQLRASSKKVHGISDALVNSKLLILFCNRVLYGRAISRFYFVFKTLEDELQKHVKAGTQGFQEVAASLPELYRAAGIEKDLLFFLGKTEAQVKAAGGWAPLLEETPAVADYCQHLRALSRDDPLMLLAHSYTQHLAMAGGGQIIARLARKHMALPADQGTSFFDFTGRKAPTVRDEFKAALDARGALLTPELRQKMVVEHIGAFGYNNRIIAEFPVGWFNTGRALATNLFPSLLVAIAKRPKVLGSLALVLGLPVLIAVLMRRG